jgi:hypothetical protein
MAAFGFLLYGWRSLLLHPLDAGLHVRLGFHGVLLSSQFGRLAAVYLGASTGRLMALAAIA